MKNKRIFKKIVSTLSMVKDLKAIILHGSFAREDYGPRSDIDLVLIIRTKEALEEIQNAIVSLDVGRSIQPIVRTETEIAETDSGLLQNLFLEGKMLFLREPMDFDVAALLRLKPFLIYTFDLALLDQKTKAKFNRTLYARSRDNYDYPGLLSTLKGGKLASGCITVPVSQRKALERFFRSFKVTWNAVRVWK